MGSPACGYITAELRLGLLVAPCLISESATDTLKIARTTEGGRVALHISSLLMW